MNPLDAQCNRQRDDAICVSQLKSAKDIDRGVLQEKPDVKIFLPFRFYLYRPEELFMPNTYNRFLGKLFQLNFFFLFYYYHFLFLPLLFVVF